MTFDKRHIFRTMLAMSVLMGVMILTYNTIIGPRYLYIGLKDDLLWDRLQLTLFSIGILTSLLALLPNGNYKLLALFQLIIPVTSIHILYLYGVASIEVLKMVVLAMVIIIALFPLKYIPYHLVIARKQTSLIVVGLLFISVYCILLIQEKGIFNFVVDLAEVYEFRAKATANYVTSLFRGFALSFAAVLLALSLVYRRWFLFAIVCGAYIIFFIYSGHRRVMFLPVFMCMAYFLVNRRQHLSLIWIFSTIILITLILDIYLDYRGASNLLVRRTLFMPPLMISFYEQFFSEQGFMYFSHSKIGYLLGTYDPAAANPALAVGDRFFPRADGANANANWIGSAFMNFGMWGIAVYGIFVAILFSLSDWLKNRNNQNVFLIASVGVYSSFMQNSDLVSSILSNGVGIFVVIILIWGNMKRTLPSKISD